MEIVNKTPHNINIISAGGMIVVPADSNMARVQMTANKTGIIKTQYGDIDQIQVKFGRETVGLPEPKAGVIYIVSMITCQANRSRDDLYIVSDTVRDNDGGIIGARGLSLNPFYK